MEAVWRELSFREMDVETVSAFLAALGENEIRARRSLAHHFLKTFDFVGGLGRFRAVSRNLNLNLSLNELLLSSPAVGF